MTRTESLRILIVEDEILIAIELENLLQEIGHEVVGVAAFSAEAVALGRDLAPDLAFVDVHLADGPTGVETARRLARDHGVAVLFMTANAKRIPHDFKDALGVIAKPYTERGVRQALDDVITALRAGDDGPEPEASTSMPFRKGPASAEALAR